MSATARSATTRPARPRPTSRPEPRRRPVLREVPPPAPSVAGNGIFAIIVVGMLVGGMLLLLVLNTSLAQGSFEMGALSRTQRDLAVQEQRLVQQVALAESPESLQRRAERLGMVPASSPVFLRLADGVVLGLPKPAPAAARSGTRTPTTAGTAPVRTPATTTVAPPVTGPAPGGRTASDAAVADATPQSDAAVPDTGNEQ